MNAILKNTLRIMGERINPDRVVIDLKAISDHCQRLTIPELHAFGELPLIEQHRIATRGPRLTADQRDADEDERGEYR